MGHTAGERTNARRVAEIHLLRVGPTLSFAKVLYSRSREGTEDSVVGTQQVRKPSLPLAREQVLNHRDRLLIWIAVNKGRCVVLPARRSSIRPIPQFANVTPGT